MSSTILQPNRSYTFSDYFNLANPTREIVAEFDYTFVVKKLELPSSPLPPGKLDDLRRQFYQKLPSISLNSEAAKREFLVSPLIFELLDYVDFSVDVEYPLHINERLRGSVDYLIRAAQNLIVIEAKNADMDRGFTQLAVEMIALDHFVPVGEAPIYGAITVGDIWRFGTLNRQTRIISRDIDAFLVPADLDDLFAVLIGILQNSD